MDKKIGGRLLKSFDDVKCHIRSCNRLWTLQYVNFALSAHITRTLLKRLSYPTLRCNFVSGNDGALSPCKSFFYGFRREDKRGLFGFDGEGEGEEQSPRSEVTLSLFLVGYCNSFLAY